jgi:antitoxin (DNA-binding transcriptional repressor) of toxin-antitoxin stability system
MREYARSALVRMLTAVAGGADLDDVLEAVADTPGAAEAVMAALGPAVVALQQVGIRSTGQAGRGGVSLGQAEQDLRQDGREVRRRMLQAVMEAAGAGEQRRSGGVAGPDGKLRTRVEAGHARDVVTVFGRVRVSRLAYRAPGASNVHPLDAALDLPAGLYSPGLGEWCVREAVRGSFDEAGDAIEYATGVRIGTRQLIDLTQAAARDTETFHTDRSRDLPDADPGDAVVITADGKGVAVLTPVPRTVEDILPALTSNDDPTGTGNGGDPKLAKAPKATGKWLTVSLTQDIPTVIAAGFDEATRRDPTHARDRVTLIDGNTTQIDAITAQAARRHAEVTVLVDYLHVSGYVWDAAKAFFNTSTAPGAALARPWVHGRNRMILHGQALEVADRIRARIRARIRTSKLTAAQRKSAMDAATYLTNKAPYLDYPTALSRGWPIATGVIEGSCRYAVQDRLGATGTRWRLDTAQAVLSLRAITTNGDFPQHWNHHQHQEHQRTYYPARHPPNSTSPHDQQQ